MDGPERIERNGGKPNFTTIQSRDSGMVTRPNQPQTTTEEDAHLFGGFDVYTFFLTPSCPYVCCAGNDTFFPHLHIALRPSTPCLTCACYYPPSLSPATTLLLLPSTHLSIPPSPPQMPSDPFPRYPRRQTKAGQAPALPVSRLGIARRFTPILFISHSAPHPGPST
ncbi:hypothetical protein BS50DRAFT_349430 [Corynespora cassiicola Philippines]|uniref:Uncharacterized protein n=1 Tax=Corynespora cassiicola Philippines TaxID=1448308 RepID=A0A2T2NQZ2_CORCC|nr:hypothetical protein BS50DRAFT_349430 [Corynespora cassiicola Philippines]